MPSRTIMSDYNNGTSIPRGARISGFRVAPSGVRGSKSYLCSRSGMWCRKRAKAGWPTNAWVPYIEAMPTTATGVTEDPERLIG